MALDPVVKEFATAKNFAALTTMLPDGQPMNHLVWIDADDEHVIFNTDPRRIKFANIKNDPRVAIAIWDANDPERYVEVRGVVVETITGPAAIEHIDKCSRKYWGKDFPEERKVERVMVKVAPRRARGNNVSLAR